MTWNPQLYLRFGDERSQPFFDLVHRLPAIEGGVRRVLDLGCGPGQLTATLCERFPDAEVVGVDSSAEMVAAARAAGQTEQDEQTGRYGRRLRFVLDDAITHDPPEPPDVLVSNAALQWIDDHVGLLERWLGLVRPGGAFAFQVPGNFGSASHRSFAEQVRAPLWRDRIDPAVLDRPRSAEPEVYLERLLSLGAAAQVWETTYLHVLQGEDPVLHWIRATALRPVLAALDPADAVEFEVELAERLRAAYPAGPHGTVFPFRRIFAVAVRP